MEWKGKKMKIIDRIGRSRRNRITKKDIVYSSKNLEGRNVRDKADSLT